ncbi:MAG: hypothetical protein M1834_002791 [Cirrosporium novae-zelandiae]|nr:MAG: hypothetical protein M1834_002791 [Cirrosporium novae-zelandiae]
MCFTADLVKYHCGHFQHVPREIECEHLCGTGCDRYVLNEFEFHSHKKCFVGAQTIFRYAGHGKRTPRNLNCSLAEEMKKMERRAKVNKNCEQCDCESLRMKVGHRGDDSDGDLGQPMSDIEAKMAGEVYSPAYIDK